MKQYKTNRRSGATPTAKYVQSLIRDAIADGSQLKLIDMEQRGLVIYRAKDGTYQLTDEGKQFLTGGRR